MYWANRAKVAERPSRAADESGDKYIRNSDGTFT